MIGRYAIDALALYYQPDHEYYRQWVALSAPQSSRKGRGGVQGYLLLSVALLGPSDKPLLHDAAQEVAADTGGPSSVLLPPTIKQELGFLRVGVHSARHLLPSSSSLASKVDAFVQLEYAGYVAKTKSISSTAPMWLTEFWVPLMLPTLGEGLVIKLEDKQSYSHDVHLGTIRLRTNEVLRGTPLALTWHHMYEGDEATKQRARALDRLWFGKILLSLSLEKPSPSRPLPEKLMQV